MPKLTLKFLILVLSVVVAGCSADAPTPDDGNDATNLGTRTYKLDPEAAAVQVSISAGIASGLANAGSETADAAKFQFLMRTLKHAGELTTVLEKASDGTVYLCGVFAGNANHEEIYDLIRSLQMTSKSTNLTAVSTSNCATTIF